MVTHKFLKSCGIISRIHNTLGVKSKKKNYYSLIHTILLTVSMSGPLPIEQIKKNIFLKELKLSSTYVHPSIE